MLTNRREFLSTTAAATVVGLSSQIPWFLRRAAAVEADTDGENILVIVQLSGGNDGLNTVIPYGDDAYHRNRFSLGYRANAVLKIDDYHGLHPAMRGFADLLEAGELSIIQGVGYPRPNRSHFESMDIWHTALRDVPSLATGWLGRGLDIAKRTGGDLPAMHFGGEVQPLALRGRDVAVPSLRSLESFRLDTGGDQRLKQTIREAASARRDNGNDLLSFLQANTTAALHAADRLEQAAKSDRGAARYPGTDLARKLKSIAQLIHAGLNTRIYYVTLDGFDTHSNQRDAHAGLLGELSGAVAAFLKDVQEQGHGERVLVMTFSEFGRRVKENASNGTDHGAAAPMFLAGHRAIGGLMGEHPSLTELDDGDVKFHTDFRRVYAGVLSQWLTWDAAALIGKEYAPLDVVKA